MTTSLDVARAVRGTIEVVIRRPALAQWRHDNLAESVRGRTGWGQMGVVQTAARLAMAVVRRGTRTWLASRPFVQ